VRASRAMIFIPLQRLRRELRAIAQKTANLGALAIIHWPLSQQRPRYNIFIA
jgi:hypothetical protein